MRDTVTVKVQGLDELQKKMESLPQEVAKKGIRQSLRAAALVIKEAMANHAPRDTGFMSEHFGIRTKMFRNDLAGSAFVGPEGRIDYPKKRISVASVARFLEFGTTKMAKHPFMTQAFEDQKESALAAIVSKLKAYLEKAAR